MLGVIVCSSFSLDIDMGWSLLCWYQHALQMKLASYLSCSVGVIGSIGQIIGTFDPLSRDRRKLEGIRESGEVWREEPILPLSMGVSNISLRFQRRTS